ncbi:hypothetical protein [Bremerella sp. P1]|uniref:hypothetical protein n=1 Tax=Bremerella sp. P1 TaxID=3026424 RepID=UPI0023688C75|nr:hypothetical protein [Bremerella sp. P1]WDI43380.1 hypothetical protein PSR63_05400 [Bremerella sp. P1]
MAKKQGKSGNEGNGANGPQQNVSAVATDNSQEDLRDLVTSLHWQLKFASWGLPILGAVVGGFITYLMSYPVAKIYDNAESIGILVGKIDDVSALQSDIKDVTKTLTEESKKIAKVEDYGDKFDQTHKDFIESKLKFDAATKSFNGAANEINEFSMLAKDLKTDLDASRKASEQAIAKTNELSDRLDSVSEQLATIGKSETRPGTLVSLTLPTTKPENNKDHLVFTYAKVIPPNVNYASAELKTVEVLWDEDPLPLTLSVSVAKESGEIQILLAASEENLGKFMERLEASSPPQFHLELMAN